MMSLLYYPVTRESNQVGAGSEGLFVSIWSVAAYNPAVFRTWSSQIARPVQFQWVSLSR
ncbi:hypothetical protein FHK02_2031 [Spirosoma sp. LMG 31448]|uniref:Uncharacterized protein n=1 Tax=Spirosoma utsteinense TaxID=2585773 RepID=A0ABR6W6D4_9BACT|nr:hypothetical protein [Spirosoma utsteinense]MBC3791713.1 hypothetical protein [Spirosoma utsteinense]